MSAAPSPRPRSRSGGSRALGVIVAVGCVAIVCGLVGAVVVGPESPVGTMLLLLVAAGGAVVLLGGAVGWLVYRMRARGGPFA